MRGTTRTVLAGTAGVALAAGGALTVASAASGTPPEPSGVVVTSNDESQSASLAREAAELRAQVAGLEAAVSRAAAPTPAPTTPLPVRSAEAADPTLTPEPRADLETSPPESDHAERESSEHDDGASDD